MAGNHVGGPPTAVVKGRLKGKQRASSGGGAGGGSGPMIAAALPNLAKQQSLVDQEMEEVEQSVNIQVRQRDGSSPDGGGRRSKLGQLKEQTSGAIRESLEGIKRPLSSLLRRPASRSGSRERSTAADGGEASKSRGDQQDVDRDLGGAEHSEAFKPARKTGNWGDEDAGATPSAVPVRAAASRPGTSAGRPNRNVANGDVLGQIDGQVSVDRFDASTVEIPRLDEIQANEFGMAVAQAPSMAVHRVATYKELDGALMRQAAFSTMDDIDLSLLAKCLCPEEEVREENVSWSWDYLFTSICSELRSDWDQVDETDEVDRSTVADKAEASDNVIVSV